LENNYLDKAVHSGLPSIPGLLPDGVGVPTTTYDYLRPSQFAYTSLILYNLKLPSTLAGIISAIIYHEVKHKRQMKQMLMHKNFI
jgi:hypothetical protein